MASRCQSNRDEPRCPFGDPLVPSEQRARRTSRRQQRPEEARRRWQAKRRIHHQAAENEAPQEHSFGIYAVFTIAITFVVWRLFLRAVSVSLGFDPNVRVSRLAHAPVLSQPESPTWDDPVALVAGLVLGILITWIYAGTVTNLKARIAKASTRRRSALYEVDGSPLPVHPC